MLFLRVVSALELTLALIALFLGMHMLAITTALIAIAFGVLSIGEELAE